MTQAAQQVRLPLLVAHCCGGLQKDPARILVLYRLGDWFYAWIMACWQVTSLKNVPRLVPQLLNAEECGARVNCHVLTDIAWGEGFTAGELAW